jgi:dihydroorotase/N-acyl-D-amino-acid deacylase
MPSLPSPPALRLALFRLPRFRLSILAGLLLASAALTRAEPDLLIKNGRVFTGASADTPLVAADVAITGDRISALGPNLTGPAKRTIDATGLVVSPGFIDLHAHIESFTDDRPAQSAVRQGVTLVVGNPDGGGPVDLAALFTRLQSSGIGPNAAYLVGHNSIRTQVMGVENRAPTAAELQSMQALVATAMRAGAFGLSTGLLYLPGSYSKRDEVVALARIASGFGGIYTSHLRKEGLGLLEGVDEAILIGEEAKIPVVLTHHKAIGTQMRGASVQSLARVDAARARGLDIMIDQYPYTATSTALRVLIPTWAMAGDNTSAVANLAQRLRDPVERAKIEKEIAFNLLNDRGGGDLACIQFSRFAWKPELNGKTMKDWALAEGREPTVATGVDLVLRGELNGGASCIFHVVAEEDVLRIMRHPQTMIASDGRLSRPGQDHPHPRAYGTFPRVLGVYVREKKNLPLESALFKMTGQPARRLGLTDRGVLKIGAHADLALFDPATVADQSTFESPHHYPVGIPCVIINGRVAFDESGYHDVRAGRLLRGPGATTP